MLGSGLGLPYVLIFPDMSSFSRVILPSGQNFQNRHKCPEIGLKHFNFHVWATSETKERVGIVKKFDLDYLWISILYQSLTLKKCFRKNVHLSARLSLWQSPNIAPKPIIDRYRWNSISGVLSKYPGPFIFNFPPIPKINSSSHKKRKIKILIFSKIASTILIKCYGFIVLSTPNNIILSVFLEKFMKLENYFLIYCPSSKHWPISFKFDISCKYLQPVLPFSTKP